MKSGGPLYHGPPVQKISVEIKTVPCQYQSEETLLALEALDALEALENESVEKSFDAAGWISSK
ncbi:hypothetical protein [Salinicoccus kekensis]|uniref:hypothetical protein n=1 Tax=Salinicoccus kekensis TaxID=714307 RepID=UPI00117A15F7|nr:hypothetical protein [Salinicoccus kekensis]